MQIPFSRHERSKIYTSINKGLEIPWHFSFSISTTTISSRMSQKHPSKTTMAYNSSPFGGSSSRYQSSSYRVSSSPLSSNTYSTSASPFTPSPRTFLELLEPSVQVSTPQRPLQSRFSHVKHDSGCWSPASDTSAFSGQAHLDPR